MVGGWPRRVDASVLASSTGTVIGADLRTMLLRKRADALTDPVRSGRQRCFALVDLLHDLLSPVARVGAAGDGRLAGHPGRTYSKHRDRETNGALGGDEAHCLGENRHMKTSLEICGVVLSLRRRRAGAASPGSFALKLLLQPLVESVAAFHAHSSKGTIDGSELPNSALDLSPRRLRRRALAAASREATVRSGTFSAVAISRLVKP